MEKILGESPEIEKVRERVEKVAKSDVRVLILGEPGTGKELVAESIHALSSRAAAPLVKINCCALPESLIESELFGHERGAFTGAHEKRIGKFEQADGGVLFLDEIGEMPYTAQAKLLRVLQTGELQRVGGRKTITVNVRVVAATNRNLKDAVAGGQFRDDLYHRLAVVCLTTPPLRARPQDAPLIAQAFLSNSSRPLMRLSPSASKSLRAYQWPGNVRELKNVSERLEVFAPADAVRGEDVREAIAMDSEYTVQGPGSSSISNTGALTAQIARLADALSRYVQPERTSNVVAEPQEEAPQGKAALTGRRVRNVTNGKLGLITRRLEEDKVEVLELHENLLPLAPFEKAIWPRNEIIPI